jgi:TonB family protein
MHLEGRVKLLVTVAPDGKPRSNEVVGGNPVLARATQDAISRWRWAAAPHETKEVIELRFHNQ